MNQIIDLKYAFVFSFVLPKEDWLDEYYTPHERNFKKMEHKYFETPVAMEVVNLMKQEINLYYKHSHDGENSLIFH